jgi:integrase
MTAVKAFIRVSSNKKKIEKEVAVRFRVSDGRRIQLFYKSDILVDPAVWDPKRESIKPKILFRPMERVLFDESVRRMKTTLETVYQEAEDKDTLTSESLELLVDKKLHPENYEDEKVTRDRDFFNQFEYFLQVKNYPESDNKNYITMIRMLKRFQLYKTITNCSEWVLDFDTINVDTIREIEDFIRNEYRIVNHAVYKVIYEEIPEGRIPRPRGENTIAKLMKRFRTFIKWCMKEGLLKTDPYVGYEQKSPMYGTPYYITIEERTKIYETNLHDAWEKLPEEKKTSIKESSIPQLERQRDIFIFQCMIGCRVGDLIHFTKNNLINGKICYIPHKTSHDRLDSIEVPLNETAKSILKRYADKYPTDQRLLPFISAQKYNDSIKDVFLLCGITRIVTVWNSTTGKEEQHPLNELASSHLARRTFIGNLYKKVQDPNLIGKLSGHKEGSKAFLRYRAIDDEMKQNLVNMLE